MEQRLHKLLSGVCSRRRAEEWILEGRVTVNGRRAVLGQKADPERDEILLDGRPLDTEEEKVYLLLNKPRGCVTTLSDERGRRTAAELVAECGVRVYPVGRLDYDSEGLLLFTNDGALAWRLTHPGAMVEKTYLVTVRGAVEGADRRLRALRDLEGEAIRPAKASLVRRTGPEEAVLSVTIHEGKNRQIRRMCAQCGLQILRLRRIREDGLTLGNLPAGKWRYLTAEETARLLQPLPKK